MRKTKYSSLNDFYDDLTQHNAADDAMKEATKEHVTSMIEAKNSGQLPAQTVDSAINKYRSLLQTKNKEHAEADDETKKDFQQAIDDEGTVINENLRREAVNDINRSIKTIGNIQSAISGMPNIPEKEEVLRKSREAEETAENIRTNMAARDIPEPKTEKPKGNSAIGSITLGDLVNKSQRELEDMDRAKGTYFARRA